MKKLFDLVELASNTEDAVVLKIKPDSKMDLICLGCFNGDEDILRLTKGRNITCTIWTKEGKSYSWCWGDGGHTLVTDNMTKRGHMIQQCIEDGFDILVCGSKESIRKAMSSTSKTHKIVLWERSWPAGCGCRKDDEYFRDFPSMDSAIQHFKDLGYEVTFSGSKPNCCNSLSYYYTISK